MIDTSGWWIILKFCNSMWKGTGRKSNGDNIFPVHYIQNMFETYIWTYYIYSRTMSLHATPLTRVTILLFEYEGCFNQLLFLLANGCLDCTYVQFFNIIRMITNALFSNWGQTYRNAIIFRNEIFAYAHRIEKNTHCSLSHHRNATGNHIFRRIFH